MLWIRNCILLALWAIPISAVDGDQNPMLNKAIPSGGDVAGLATALRMTAIASSGSEAKTRKAAHRMVKYVIENWKEILDSPDSRSLVRVMEHVNTISHAYSLKQGLSDLPLPEDPLGQEEIFGSNADPSIGKTPGGRLPPPRAIVFKGRASLPPVQRPTVRLPRVLMGHRLPF